MVAQSHVRLQAHNLRNLLNLLNKRKIRRPPPSDPLLAGGERKAERAGFWRRLSDLWALRQFRQPSVAGAFEGARDTQVVYGGFAFLWDTSERIIRTEEIPHAYSREVRIGSVQALG